MSERVVLLTGGNLGDVAGALEEARRQIAREVGPVVAASAVMESAAWGFESDDRFLNQVLVSETELAPHAVLERTQRIERRLGRIRPAPGHAMPEQAPCYGSRTMDIDILFYGSRVIAEPDLMIPHPLIAARGFVLRPLAQVLPALRHPQTGLTPGEMLARLAQTQENDEKTTNNE